ncbi:MAG: hypothetical protein NVSMB12_03990 [Acidimicrobiales bacterium]
MASPSKSEHRLAGYHYDSDSGEHEARCSCGWVSAPFTDPGTAGQIWDRHVASEGMHASGC